MKEVTNIPASIHARLSNVAKKQGGPFNELFHYYCIERFLFRLSQTEYQSMFVLKGGLIFHALKISQHRSTRDIDFRGFTNNSILNLTRIIRSICAVSYPQDGLVFDPDNLRFEEIPLDADYNGVRIIIKVSLGMAKTLLQIDIGFSDVITPEKMDIDYPVLLEGLAAPAISGYPSESIISEKLHALVYLGEINSRFKDFYDIWLLSEEFNFEGRILQDAVIATFRQRNTEIPNGTPVGLTDEFARKRQEQWEAYLKKNKLIQENNQKLVHIINRLRTFLLPLVQTIAEGDQLETKWIAGIGWR